MIYSPMEYIGVIIIFVIAILLIVLTIIFGIIVIARRRKLGETLQNSNLYTGDADHRGGNNPDPHRDRQTNTTGRHEEERSNT
jgi:hypothetical protein